MKALLLAKTHFAANNHQTAELLFDVAVAKRVDDCPLMLQATAMQPFPDSAAARDKALANFHSRMDALLKQESIYLDPQIAAGLGQDEFRLCMNSAFHHSFYYADDARERIQKYFQLAIKRWPDLLYIAPHLRTAGIFDDDETSPAVPAVCSNIHGGSCEPARQIRLGVVSAFLSDPKHSVTSDFGLTMKKLPRDVFKVCFVDVHDGSEPREVSVALLGDETIHVTSGPNWLEKARSAIEGRFDVLLYLDHTMSPLVQRLGMSRLAKVQAASHGHPMTTGIETMDYFVSWAAAELEEAQEHYTEELVLLPASTPHQYYEPRTDENGYSTLDAQSFAKLTRADFPTVPAAGKWYLCMQMPFKRHPEFDAGILLSDPAARVILQDDVTDVVRIYVTSRLAGAGADVSRVHFLQYMQQHKVLALYALSDVVLDSYPSSGCTTTRDALSVNAPVVTLPAQYLGSRWSLAYYTILQVTDLVAEDAADYIRLAVKVANDEKFRQDVQKKLAENLHKLYKQDSAVDAWTNVLTDIATRPRKIREGTKKRPKNNPHGPRDRKPDPRRWALKK